MIEFLKDLIEILSGIWLGLQTIGAGIIAGLGMILISLVRLIQLPIWHLQRAINRFQDRRQQSPDRHQD